MPRLKIMTLNMWGFRGNWPLRRDRLLQCLQDEEIDVVLLQEVADRAWRLNQAEEVAHLSGYAMSFVPSQLFFPWPPVATGLAVLSRFPMSNQLAMEIFPPTSPIPTGRHQRRIAQRVELLLDGMSVVVYNTHFPLRAQERVTAAYRLWSQVVQDEAVLIVVGGDLNARPEESAIGFLQGKVSMDGMRGALVDAWGTAGIGPAETFPAAAPQARIDYIFYQAEPSVIVQETKVLGIPPQQMSDHAAVVSTFSISPTRDPVDPLVAEPVATLTPTIGGGGGLFGDY